MSRGLASRSHVPERGWKDAVLLRLGIEPRMTHRLRALLALVVADAERASPGHVRVLDAGCGRKSPLAPFRERIDWFSGVDQHTPEPAVPWLDEFIVADLCDPGASVGSEPYDVVLSNFTLEHFRDPPVAIANFQRWLRPGGMLVLTTVNRRHPFVALYLGAPRPIRDRVQPLVKASPADAHRLVGACNDPAAIRSALAVAGFATIRLETVPNLARAWGRHAVTFVLGAIGDLLVQRSPGRRSTILAVARRPDATAR